MLRHATHGLTNPPLPERVEVLQYLRPSDLVAFHVGKVGCWGIVQSVSETRINLDGSSTVVPEEFTVIPLSPENRTAIAMGSEPMPLTISLRNPEHLEGLAMYGFAISSGQPEVEVSEYHGGRKGTESIERDICHGDFNIYELRLGRT